MEECAFTPGINWHTPNIMDCCGLDYLLYAFKTHIVVVKWTSEGYAPSVILHAHDERVHAIAAAPEKAAALGVASCGDDGLVRLWSLESLTLLKAHNSHHTKSSNKGVMPVTGLSWSPVDPNLIISVSVNGCVVTWHVAENVTRKCTIARMAFTGVACSPTDKEVIAISGGGQIFVVRLELEAMKISKLRVFQGNVVGMRWQPCAENPILAATSQRGEIACWDVKTTKCLFKLQPRHVTMPNRAVDGMTIYPVLWHSTDTLLARSGNELIALNVDAFITDRANQNWRQEGVKWRIVHAAHRRDFSSLASHGQNGWVWTAGSDRSFVMCDVLTGKVVRTVGTLYGGAISAAVSPHDSNLLAFGSADGSVRIWNITESTGKAVSEHRNVLDKVMSVCWHYEKEHTLVYGTSAGRVGVMDTRRASHPVLLAASGCTPVYWLCWGPPFFPEEEEDAKMLLYAVTNKTIYVYSKLVANSPGRDLGSELELPSIITDITWKSDFSLLTVGCRNGAICLLRPGCKTPVSVIGGPSAPQYLSWHPLMTSSDTVVSPYQNLLTCGATDTSGVINVYKVDDTEGSITWNVFTTLTGHGDYVQSVAWSPHVSGHLVSSSGDCSIQIWNVLTSTPMVNYRPNPFCLNWFAIWSPIHTDYIISGNSNSMLQVWKISNKPDTIPPKDVKPRKNKRHKVAYKCEMGKEVGIANAQETKSAKDEIEPQEKMAQPAQFGPKPSGVISNAWIKAADFTACYKLLKSEPLERERNHSLCFLNTDDVMIEKLKLIGKTHDENDRVDASSATMLWQGRLKEFLEKKIEDGGLTPNLVALAPSVSPRLWVQACCAYARQLRAARAYSQAANYLVAARKVEEALEVLTEGKLYDDALCLARNQLPKDDPLFLKILREYGEVLASFGNFSRAAECWIYLEEYEQISKALARCTNAAGLATAAFCARKIGNVELEAETALGAFGFSILKKDPDITNVLISEHPDIESLVLLFKIYISLTTSNKESESILDQSLKDPVLCYSQINAIQMKVAYNEGQQWKKIQELSFACCAPQQQTKLRHVLRALEASHLQGAAELCALCHRISPGLEKRGVFTAESALGTSLRAFLCLALLHTAEACQEQAVCLMPRIISLYSDLLDEKAFNYHRAKYTLPGLQKSIANKSIPINKKKEEINIEPKETCNESIQTCRSEVENNLKHETRNATENDNDDAELSAAEHKVNHRHEAGGEDENQTPSLATLVDERNRLVLAISRTETERGVVPNPVMGFLLLRTLCQQLSSQSDEAKQVLEIISEKYSSYLH